MINGIYAFQSSYQQSVAQSNDLPDKHMRTMHALLHGNVISFTEVQELYEHLVCNERPNIPPPVQVYQKSLLAIWTVYQKFSMQKSRHLVTLKSEKADWETELRQTKIESATEHRKFSKSGPSSQIVDNRAILNQIETEIQTEEKKVQEICKEEVGNLFQTLVNNLLSDGCMRSAHDLILLAEDGEKLYPGFELKDYSAILKSFPTRVCIKVKSEDLEQPEEIKRKFEEMRKLHQTLFSLLKDETILELGRSSAEEVVRLSQDLTDLVRFIYRENFLSSAVALEPILLKALQERNEGTFAEVMDLLPAEEKEYKTPRSLRGNVSTRKYRDVLRDVMLEHFESDVDKTEALYFSIKVNNNLCPLYQRDFTRLQASDLTFRTSRFREWGEDRYWKADGCVVS